MFCSQYYSFSFHSTDLNADNVAECSADDVLPSPPHSTDLDIDAVTANAVPVVLFSVALCL